MAGDAGDIDLRRDLLEHLARGEFSFWMNAQTSCSHIAQKYGLDRAEVFDGHFRELKKIRYVEENTEGHRVTPAGREVLGGRYLNPLEIER